jgi:hypothetical protein
MDRKCKSSRCQCWLRWGFILSPSARTGLADLALRAKPATRRVADGERMNPREKDGEPTPGLQFGLQFIAVRAGSVEYARRVSPAARTAMNPYELAALKLLIRGFKFRAAGVPARPQR